MPSKHIPEKVQVGAAEWIVQANPCPDRANCSG